MKIKKYYEIDGGVEYTTITIVENDEWVATLDYETSKERETMIKLKEILNDKMEEIYGTAY